MLVAVFVAGVVIAGVIGFMLAIAQWSADGSADTAPRLSTASPDVRPTTSTERPLPTDCRAIHSAEFQERHAETPLNDPGVVGTDVPRFGGIEALREDLPGIECHWGPPTEGGVTTAVNRVTEPQRDQALALIRSHGSVCEEWNGGTLCRYSSGPQTDDPAGWVIAEQYYFRDGWWVTIWWAGTRGSIETDARAVYDTLWP